MTRWWLVGVGCAVGTLACHHDTSRYVTDTVDSGAGDVTVADVAADRIAPVEASVPDGADGGTLPDALDVVAIAVDATRESSTADAGADALEASSDAADAQVNMVDVLVCGDGGTACGETCVNTLTDVHHCGGCSVDCTAGDAGSGPFACVRGSCATVVPTSCTTSVPGCAGLVYVSTIAPVTLGEPGSGATQRVTVSPFYLDAAEVTVARFAAWVLAFDSTGRTVPAAPPVGTVLAYPPGGTRSIEWPAGAATSLPPYTDLNARYNAPRTWTASPARAEQPVNAVDYWTAQAFCRWDGGRLPTEAEWATAAQGWTAGSANLTPGRPYPWGSATPTCARATFDSDGTSTYCHASPAVGDPVTRPYTTTMPVGGIYDLAGNVEEWTADVNGDFGGGAGCWPSGTTLADPLCQGTVDDNQATVRRNTYGGSFSSSATQIFTYDRVSRPPGTLANFIGFRCARSP